MFVCFVILSDVAQSEFIHEFTDEGGGLGGFVVVRLWLGWYAEVFGFFFFFLVFDLFFFFLLFEFFFFVAFFAVEGFDGTGVARAVFRCAVEFHVAFEFGALGAGVIADVAFIRSFAGVGSTMDREIALESEFFPAEFAGVDSIGGVGVAW